MLHKQKTCIVGDRVLINKQQGTVKYIGELISSKGVWIGVQLLDYKTSLITGKITKQSKYNATQNKNEWTAGKIDNIIYIKNKNNTPNILFVPPTKITKWFRGVDNKHLSRKFHINQQVWVKSIKCKATVKSMFYDAPQYILKQTKQKKGKQYLGILLKKPFGNNISNKVKYFQCEDKYDYFVKIDPKKIIPLTEYNERLSCDNLELIIDYWFREYCDHFQLAQEFMRLLISFYGAMDGTLNLRDNEVFKYKEHCINMNDYYEYDSVYLGKGSLLRGGKLICIKCFGDFVIDEWAEISVRATVNLTDDKLDQMSYTLKFGARGWMDGGKGGGIIKIICFGNVILRSNALISANGESTNCRAHYGSGGTIYIKCEKLINYGRILTRGCGNELPTYNNYHRRWGWDFYWDRGDIDGNVGKIIIDGEYSEDGCPPQSSQYCGPVLIPKQPHLKHLSANW